MKYLTMVVITLAGIFFSNVTAATCEETVILTNGEWAPYFSENMKYYGIGSRIISEAFALEGVRVKYEFYPWKRGLMLSQEGICDGAVGWEINFDRKQYFYESELIWESEWVFFHLKKYNFDWKTFDDLKNIKIGGTLEYMYTPGFLEAERSGKIRVDRAASDQLGYKKLLAERFDIFPQLLDIGYYQLQKQFTPETFNLFTHHPTSFGKHKEYLLLSKRHEHNRELIERFNRGLRRLKESGEYQRYFKEFKMEDQVE